MSKKTRIKLAVLWGILTLPAAFIAMVLFGLARMDTGWVSPEPSLMVLWVFPFTLFVSCIVELMTARGTDTPAKASFAKVFAFLPLGHALIIAALTLVR